MNFIKQIYDKIGQIRKRRLLVRCVMVGFVASLFLISPGSPAGPAPANAACGPEMPVVWALVLILMSSMLFLKIRKIFWFSPTF